MDEIEADLDADDPNEPSPDDRLDEQTLGPYRLWFKLAKGGMATVYLGTSDGAGSGDRVVAVKCIHEHLASEQSFVDMFLDEARIASRIRHPNVCTVFDYGQVGSQYYLAMDYLLGESLQRLMRALSRPSETADARLARIGARVIADAARGLHAAHELVDASGDNLNVVHRDVSPHNLYVTYDGEVRVVDFGVASAKDRVHKTEAGKVKGKFAYMSPEQLQGHKVDRRTDVWALGVVLWEFLTLRRLFRRRADVETMYAVLTAEVVAPSKIRPWVPAKLDAIVLRALERDPDKRFASAEEMASAIETYLASEASRTTASDVAEWMGRLFSGSLRRKRELLAAACRASGVPPAIVEESTDPTSTGTAETVNFAEPVGRRPEREARWIWSTAMVIGSAALGGLAALMLAPDTVVTATVLQNARASGAETVVAEMAAERAQDSASEDVAGGDDSTNRAEVSPAGESGTGESASGESGAGKTGADTTETGIGALPPDDSSEESTTGERSPNEESVDDPALAASPEGTDGAPDASGNDPVSEDAKEASSDPSVAEAQQPDEAVEGDDDDKERTGATTSRRRRARATGVVNVVTPGGWAEVYFRGRKLGPSPLRATLPAGRQVLELRPFGTGAPRTVIVEVSPSRPERVRLDVAK